VYHDGDVVQSRKRAWIYLGLGLPSGRAYARAASGVRVPIVAGDRILLAGDALVGGIYAPLAQLAAAADVQLEAIAIPGVSTAAWAEAPWLPGVLADYRPTAIVWALDPGEDAAWRLRALARAVGTRTVCWMPPPSGLRRLGPARALPSEIVVRPGRDCILPTAAGFAGWAGTAWYACGAGMTAAPAV
jgi:hypothetical protein